MGVSGGGVLGGRVYGSGGQGTHLGLGRAVLGLGVSGCGCPLPVFAGWRLGGG